MKKVLITLYLFSIILFLTLSTHTVYANSTNPLNGNSSINAFQNSININSTSTVTTQDTSSDSDDTSSLGFVNLILRSVLLGFIIATSFCIFVWIKHKPVRLAKNATKYLDTSTINITNSYDHCISSYTEKKAIYKNN